MAMLVAGGAGYIGSHAVRMLIDEGYDVVVVDNLETGHKDAIHPKATFYEGDVRDRAFLEQVFSKEGISCVFHFCAYSLVGESTEKPLAYFNNNVYGLMSLLEVMHAHGVDKLIFSSTAAVYGEPAHIPIQEDDQKAPTNPYGESKWMMEKIMSWCEATYNIKYVALRYFNVAGAIHDGSIGEDHHPETHLIPIVLQVALHQREHITIFGDDYDTEDGTCIRDYLHVEDLIEAHINAYHYLEAGHPSDVFNLGTSHGFSVKEIIEASRRVTGQPIKAELGERRAGDPSKLVANSQKAATHLNFKPKHDHIDAIIKSAWNWHKNHPNGYEDA
ncbi:UDP-glucose 4-epimerase GalE [Staphylococcus massiliensis]|uniref:UDP-glucose 4-epimerase n=1 Tax=Staphylococcus massiliensis S46 TaxID=1229783 RepID=K9B2F5_9STAP|nr:UDP-glucose 4-epimerase GalE [Staphylococcus massiliensis]EKU48957.1 UDP-glucose-4-epimerase GalE [Staphylococcus massiliensis S46]MCG3399397.1 UDP-glucose 4-epimerase GalE [Staphylococcus massiliensis]MCG3402502.1 UDP-glucose 4-epimerase GalE [Staphylococcus massiliensis]MCG3411533.1 UDP-glucose 4-epimerase GalE [Staphylococcus massiliensis]PNZ98761.1 UDP-glucose 4-epimerase GalE [Staphylococcus massiliensis CCUG 55927]